VTRTRSFRLMNSLRHSQFPLQRLRSYGTLAETTDDPATLGAPVPRFRYMFIGLKHRRIPKSESALPTGQEAVAVSVQGRKGAR
jgi:hypothetical protein